MLLAINCTLIVQYPTIKHVNYNLRNKLFSVYRVYFYGYIQTFKTLIYAHLQFVLRLEKLLYSLKLSKLIYIIQ